MRALQNNGIEKLRYSEFHDYTLPLLLYKRANETPNLVAIRKKKFGIWHEYSWKQFLDEVRYTFYGLITIGFKKGDVIVVLSENEPQILFTAFAAQIAGGTILILYPDMLPEHVREIIKFTEARYVLARDQRQVDKILKVKEDLPKLEKLIYIEPKGLIKLSKNYQFLMSFKDLLESGMNLMNQRPELFEIVIKSLQPDDIAFLSLTSGTTRALPKLAMLTHRNLIYGADCWLTRNPKIDGRDDDIVVILPLAWVAGLIPTISLLSGARLNFPESPQTVFNDLREIAPTFFGGAPRLWEQIAAEIMYKAEDSSWLKRKFYNFSIRIGKKIALMEIEHRSIPLHYKILRFILYWLVYRQILDKIGFKRIKVAFTGGGALGPDYFLLFRALGVNLKEVYGSTECAAATTFHIDDDVKLGTAGKPVPGTEIKITEEGEIWVKNPGVCKGYYKDPIATAKSFIDGWFRTEDVGFFDTNGHLVIIDRLGDVIKLRDGKIISPTYVENKLKFSPYIRDAAVYGDQEKSYLVAIVCIDFEYVSKWAEQRNIAYTDYADLSQKPEVLSLIRQIIVKVNSELPEHMKIKKFVSLYKEFDADDLELTRTRKLRRKYVYTRYANIIEAMYSGLDKVKAVVPIVYEDGTQTLIERELKIIEVD